MARFAMSWPICGSPGSRAGRAAISWWSRSTRRRSSKIGVWPWPRRLHAELLRRLRGRSQDIALDVDFSTPSDPASDRAFVEALRGAGGSTVLPAFKQPGADGATYFNRPLPQFRDQAWTSVVNVAVGPDGLVRRYSFGQKLDAEFLPSMGAVLAGHSMPKAPSFLIDFSIRSRRYRRCLHRRTARRRGNLEPPQGQEGRHRRHRARTR